MPPSGPLSFSQCSSLPLPADHRPRAVRRTRGLSAATRPRPRGLAWRCWTRLCRAGASCGRRPAGPSGQVRAWRTTAHSGRCLNTGAAYGSPDHCWVYFDRLPSSPTTLSSAHRSFCCSCLNSCGLALAKQQGAASAAPAAHDPPLPKCTHILDTTYLCVYLPTSHCSSPDLWLVGGLSDPASPHLPSPQLIPLVCFSRHDSRSQPQAWHATSASAPPWRPCWKALTRFPPRPWPTTSAGRSASSFRR